MENQVQAAQVSEFDKSLKVIRDMVSKAKDLKLVENEASTGFSYFAGKKRLCKLLKTKKGVTLEVNVQLPKALGELAGMENISVAVAHKKHLGTMKHLYRSNDSKEITRIMKDALAVFAKEIEDAKKEEAKPAETPVSKEA